MERVSDGVRGATRRTGSVFARVARFGGRRFALLAVLGATARVAAGCAHTRVDDAQRSVAQGEQPACNRGDGEGRHGPGRDDARRDGVARDDARVAPPSQQSCDAGDAPGCENRDALQAERRGVAPDDAPVAQPAQPARPAQHASDGDDANAARDRGAPSVSVRVGSITGTGGARQVVFHDLSLQGACSLATSLGAPIVLASDQTQGALCACLPPGGAADVTVRFAGRHVTSTVARPAGRAGACVQRVLQAAPWPRDSARCELQTQMERGR